MSSLAGLEIININMYGAVALAAALFWLGGAIMKKVPFFGKYCIPAPLVGGLVFALINTGLYASGLPNFSFDTTLQTVFMNMFFATVGFSVSLPLLLKGGKAVIVILLLGSILTVAQNFLGAGIMLAMGQDPRLGLALGSISLIGGPGTAAAFGPELEAAGCVGGSVVGLSAATFGLVAGSIMGGPTANRLINKYGITGRKGENEVDESSFFTTSGIEGVVAFMMILFSTGLGDYVSAALKMITGVTFPSYIGGMIVAALLRNTIDSLGIHYPGNQIDAIGEMALSIFLSMAMMTLKLWELVDLALPMIVALAAQIVLMYIFARHIVFPVMGKDYDSAVMTAGFIGFAMGATSNAMASMDAVTKKYGPSPVAYFAVPIVGGMFIDFVNVLVVGLMIPMLGKLA